MEPDGRATARPISHLRGGDTIAQGTYAPSILHQKVYDMTVYAYERIQQYPKSEKYALGTDTKQCLHAMLRLCRAIENKTYKKTTLQELDVEKGLLQDLIRLAFDNRFISMKSYEYWSEKVSEIGRIIGGMIRYQMSQPAQR